MYINFWYPIAKSEELTNDIMMLNEKRNTKLKEESDIGLNDVEANVVSIAFFKAISDIVGFNAKTVRNTFYAVSSALPGSLPQK